MESWVWDEFQSNWDALAISNAIYSLAIHVLYIFIYIYKVWYNKSFMIFVVPCPNYTFSYKLIVSLETIRCLPFYHLLSVGCLQAALRCIIIFVVGWMWKYVFYLPTGKLRSDMKKISWVEQFFVYDYIWIIQSITNI